MHEPAQRRLPSASRGLRLGIMRFSAVELLIALVALFAVAPFLEAAPQGRLLEAVLMTLVLVAAVLAVGGRHRMLIITSLLMMPALVGKWVHHIRPDLFPPAAMLICEIVFIAFIIVNLLRFILRAPKVNHEVLCASLSVYLMFGLVWSLAYRVVSAITPGAFAFAGAEGPSMQAFSAFYFSLVTLTTVGYGDITPVSNVARMLAAMESMTGTLYVAVLVARLVALYSAPHPSTPADNPDQPHP